MDKQTLTEWMEQMEMEVEGTVYISCIVHDIPYHPGTKRYQVYNEEDTYSEIFDITLDDDGYIISIE